VEQEAIKLSVVGNNWQMVLRVEVVDRTQLMGLVITVLKLKNCFVER
jgi:hypothetical protein